MLQLVVKFDLQNLSHPDRWWTKSNIRDIQVAIRTHDHRRREEEICDNHLTRSVMIETHDVSGHGRGKHISGSGRILQHVEAIAIVEGDTENGGQVRFHDVEIVMALHVVNA